MPVRNRTGFFVRGLDIDLGNGEIALDHIERGMPEQLLEGEDIAAVAQKLDGKGMAETVGMAVWHVGAVAQGVEQVLETVAGKGAVFIGDEKVGADIDFIAKSNIAPERLGGVVGKWDVAFLVPLAEGFDQ